MKKEVTTYFVEMKSRDLFRKIINPFSDFIIRRAEIPQPEINHFFFTNVGRQWLWHSRLNWSYMDWVNYLNDPCTFTYIAYKQGTPSGYFELQKDNNENVEIAFIGLLPQFIGKGLGKILLSESVNLSWDMGAKRIWAHTCTLDHPNALAAYEGRGFKIYKKDKGMELIPDPDDQIWLTPNFIKTRNEFLNIN